MTDDYDYVHELNQLMNEDDEVTEDPTITMGVVNIRSLEPESCSNCMFSSDEVYDRYCTYYLCRFNPPILNGDNFALFPKVRSSEWCGKYGRR